MKIKAGKYYFTANKSVVKVTEISTDPWGIIGYFIHTNNNNSKKVDLNHIYSWDDTAYPYIISHDLDFVPFALTDEEVIKENNPEYFI